MMVYTSFREMLLIHFLIGVGITIFVALRANKKNKNRKLFDFGTGLLGEQARWIKWYSWALTFELATSFLGYLHTQMLYYELGMSIFEAGALVVGAFAVDRLVDFFTGNFDIENVTPDLTVVKDVASQLKEKVSKAVSDLPSVSDLAKKSAETANKKAEEIVEKIKNENKKFDDLTKGH